MIEICPHCGKAYSLGINGTVDGCDLCLAIVRNPKDGTIIEMDFSSEFLDDEVTAETA